MGKITNLFQKQAKLKGSVAVSSVSKEGYTATAYITIADADLNTSRTLNTTGPYLITFDPENTKKKGIEFAIATSASQTGSQVTFSGLLRGCDLDEFDDAGSYDNAKEWTVGTPVGITTDHINWNYLIMLLAGTKFFKNSMNFDADQKFLQDVYIAYKPAYLTCGSSPTTTAATWAAVTDGEFAITIDGTAYDIQSLDFTNVGNNDQVAKVIQTAIQTATSSTEEVEWDGTQFIIRSADTTSSSAITVLSAVSGGTGTDISGAGATAYLDGDTGNGTVTNGALGRIKFGGETVYIYNNGGDMTLADDNQSAVTLSELAAAAGVDDKFKVSVADTTSGYADGKLTAGEGLSKTIGSPAGDETLGFDIDTSDTDVFVKTSSGAGDEDKVPILDGSGKLASGFIDTSSNMLITDDPQKYWRLFTTTLGYGNASADTNNWVPSNVGAGTTTHYSYLTSFTTGATSGNYESLYTTIIDIGASSRELRFDDLSAGQVIVFENSYANSAATPADVESRMGFGEQTGEAIEDAGSKATAKFFIDDNQAKIVTCDGSGVVTTENVTLTGDFDNGHRLRMVYTVGTDIKFYIDGVLVHTATTNIPLNTTAQLIYFYFGNKTTTGSAKITYFGNQPYIAISK